MVGERPPLQPAATMSVAVLRSVLQVPAAVTRGCCGTTRKLRVTAIAHFPLRRTSVNWSVAIVSTPKDDSAYRADVQPC